MAENLIDSAKRRDSRFDQTLPRAFFRQVAEINHYIRAGSACICAHRSQPRFITPRVQNKGGSRSSQPARRGSANTTSRSRDDDNPRIFTFFSTLASIF